MVKSNSVTAKSHYITLNVPKLAMFARRRVPAKRLVEDHGQFSFHLRHKESLSDVMVNPGAVNGDPALPGSTFKLWLGICLI